MEFPQDHAKSLIVHMMDRAGKKNSVEEIGLERSGTNVRGQQVHVVPPREPLSRHFDRGRIDIQPVILEIGKDVGHMPGRAPKVEDAPGP